ncbi:MAG: GGDEF domain-containing protein [Candidatus Izimaplasma sp.]|nr:GGDEF domain-containing protein [Candidatus Izimaplasma bacterium]
MKKLNLLLLLFLFLVNGFSLTRLDQLKLDLKSASGNNKILILDELQKSYWKIYPQVSLEYGIKALKITTENNDKLQQTKQLQNIAITYKNLHDYIKAIEYMTLSLNSAKKINNVDLQIVALYNLARYNNELRENVIAFEFAVQALDLSRQNNNYRELAKCHFVIAEIYYSLEDLKGAYENYEHSLNQHYRFDDKASLALTCEKLGEIDLSNVDYYFAELHYKTAAENYNEIDNLENLVRTYEALGKIYKKTGDSEKAYVYIQKFADTNEKLNRELNSNKYLYNYEYYNVIGNEEKALEYFKLYTQYQDSLQLVISQEKVEALISDIEVKHEFEQAKSTKKLEKVTKTAKEKQEMLELLEIESNFNEQVKKEQIDKLKYERKIKDMEISKQKRQQYLYLSFIVIIVVVAALLFLIAVIYIGKYRMKRKHSIDMEKIAKTDPLTKLPNRRAVLEQINYEIARFKRNANPFTIVISDIDDFKQVNDTYGHDTGDKVLISISNLIFKTIRRQDICARWGGEEFLFLLPETDNHGARIFSEKIRKKVEKNNLVHKKHNVSITMTFGICTFTKSLTIDECIRRADKALYDGKHSGKNCSTVYDKKIH